MGLTTERPLSLHCFCIVLFAAKKDLNILSLESYKRQPFDYLKIMYYI